MTKNRRRAEDVFWNLAALVSDYVLEVPKNQRTPDALRQAVRPGTRVCVPVGAQALPDAATEVTGAATAGVLPIVTMAAPAGSAMRRADGVIAGLAAAGARGLVLRCQSSATPAEVLDSVARLTAECVIGRRGITEVAIAADGLADRHAPSADLLRAFDGLRAAGTDSAVRFTLLAPRVRSVGALVAWERSLRAAGNRFPVRVRLPGIAPNPFRRTVPTLLELGAAIEADPDSMLTDVQFVLRGSASRTAAFADEISSCNFHVEETVSGYRLNLFATRR